jgi:hypothetical protein
MGSKTLLWLVCGLCLCLSLAAQAQELKIIVPAYFYPGGAGARDWQRLNAAAQKVPLWVIINPASGPGRQTDPVSRAAYKALRAAHGKTLAYVDTSYAKRPLDRVLKDIDQWLVLYPGQADGFFIDQITYDDNPAHLDYLARVYRYIKDKSRKFVVMGNPGTNTREAYLKRPVCDAIMTFENFAAEYPRYQPDAWAARYRPDRFAHILHSAPPSEEALRQALKTMQERRAGWVFITDAVYTKAHPNPYNRLPTYWEKEVEAVQKLASPHDTTGSEKTE